MSLFLYIHILFFPFLWKTLIQCLLIHSYLSKQLSHYQNTLCIFFFFFVTAGTLDWDYTHVFHFYLEMKVFHSCNDYWFELIRIIKMEAYQEFLPHDLSRLWKTLMLRKIEGKRKRGWQRTRWLDSITDSMHMDLSNLRETEKDREAWRAAVHGVTKSWTCLSDWTTTTMVRPEIRSTNKEQCSLLISDGWWWPLEDWTETISVRKKRLWSTLEVIYFRRQRNTDALYLSTPVWA